MTNPSLAEIEALTRARFPACASGPLALEPLEKGGSDRKFYRIRPSPGDPLIFVQYGKQREENSHYVEIGAFLQKAGVRVPLMFLHEAESGRIWMEDMGEQDLWTFRNEPWPVRRGLYESALTQLHGLHTAAARHPESAAILGLQPPFDATLYRWEQDYFFQNCAIRHLGLPAAALEADRARLHALAGELEQMPRCLVHRDFQSQNIVVRDGEPCFIDFQGMRFGLPQYDLASVLLDPYVDLSDSEQESLLEFYCEKVREAGGNIGGDFHQTYLRCAAQRLMQALGAYGFLGHEKGRLHFLEHIPVALPRLVSVLEKVGGMDSLARLLKEAAAKPALHKAPDAVKKPDSSC